MRKRTIVAVLACIVAFLTVYISGCSRSGGESAVSDDKIMLRIQLDLKEDIGLLIIDHDLNGKEGSGGISNADKSLLKHDEVLYWSFDRQSYDISGDTADMTLRFTVVTEYCDPNYENIYPDELKVPMEAISFRADFGSTYRINITGDRAGGYLAVLDDLD